MNRPVIVAVVPMGIVKMVSRQVVHMVSMRNSLMSASSAMTVFLTVRTAGMVWRTGGRILAVHVQSMIVHVVPVQPMQMAVVQVVHVPVVFDRGMAAVGTMGVGVPFMNVMICRHLSTLLILPHTAGVLPAGDRTLTNGKKPALSYRR